eukprot:2912911-Lingulodinium_polyedra.AAC.1
MSQVKPGSAWERRAIWGLLRYGVNSAARQGGRIMLPRFSDVVQGAAELARAGHEGEFQFCSVDVAR